MTYLDEVKIIGFWGEHNVHIRFDRELNFLIGPNGSGKTTIINLIAAVLQGDIAALYGAQFSQIIVKLTAKGSNRKPSIEVSKTVDDSMGSIRLTYNIKEKASEKGVAYGVESPGDERVYSEHRAVGQRIRMREIGSRLGKILDELVEVNWLSIHRSSLDRRSRSSRDDDHLNTVDHKIAEISKKFASYFSLLSSKANDETKNFQEHIFLSLLDEDHSSAEVWSQIDEKPADRDVVIGVLKELGVGDRKAARSVASHYSRLEAAKAKYAKEQTIDISGAVSLSSARRVKYMLQKWNELESQKKAIFDPKDKFEIIINSLFIGKELHFDERNIPKLHLSSGEQVDIAGLSSGEKQLFILLGEALLQENRPVIFISDEPELSLHVKWQSTLFENIKTLNPSSQIVSATHSPDIVGAFQSKIIRIESCFKNVH